MRITGANALMAQLRSTGLLVPANARKVMQKAADQIEEAKLNAPVDTHALERSIRQIKSYSTFRGRLQIDIDVGGVVDGIDVDVYALEVHENYDSRNPGPGTLAKMAANPGRHIGAKFLERAAQTVQPKVQPSLIQAVLAAIRGKSL
jgi:HK97 gp10 family phage protein